MSKIICFNGPPRSGKDTGAIFLSDFLRCPKFHIADNVKDLTNNIASYFGINLAITDKNKDLHQDNYPPITPREMWITVGQICKKFYGEDCWVNTVIQRIKQLQQAKCYSAFIVVDIGFQNELDRIVDEFGSENILLIYLNRDGCNYEKDSRYQVQARKGVATETIYNNYSLEMYKKLLIDIVSQWIKSNDQSH